MIFRFKRQFTALILTIIPFLLDPSSASLIEEQHPNAFSIRIEPGLNQFVEFLPPKTNHRMHVDIGVNRLASMTGYTPSRRKQLMAYRKRIERKRRSLSLSDVNLNDQSSETPANRSSSLHSIGLQPESYDMGYYGTLSIGTPLRPFKLLVDSGSADLWVGGEDCHVEGESGGDCGPHTFLGPRSSSTFNDTHKDWAIYYGSGNVWGSLARDTVSIANFTLEAFQLGVSRNESSQFVGKDVPFDGILGLAQSKGSVTSSITIVEALHQKGLIEEAVVSYKLPRGKDGTNDGEITFGALNPSKYDSASLVTLKNVNERGLWEASIDEMTINGVSMEMNRTGIFDTGTTLLIVPRDDAATIHRTIAGSEYNDDEETWTIPCNTNSSIALTFGRKDYHIDPRDLGYMPMDADKPDARCYSGIAPGDIGEPSRWLIGDTFLKNVYLSTNVGTNQISLARLA